MHSNQVTLRCIPIDAVAMARPHLMCISPTQVDRKSHSELQTLRKSLVSRYAAKALITSTDTPVQLLHHSVATLSNTLESCCLVAVAHAFSAAQLTSEICNLPCLVSFAYFVNHLFCGAVNHCQVGADLLQNLFSICLHLVCDAVDVQAWII